MCCKLNSLLRNVINYESDVKFINVSETVVCEQCIFHKIQHFHVRKFDLWFCAWNALKSVAHYHMTLIISGLIEQGCFILNKLNNKMFISLWHCKAKKCILVNL